MAAKRKKKAGKPAKAKPAKQPKAEKEPKEIKPGPPVESVLILATAGLLIAALVMLDYVKGTSYGKGMLFADSYEESAE